MYLLAALALMVIAVAGAGLHGPLSNAGFGANLGQMEPQAGTDPGSQGQSQPARPGVEVSRDPLATPIRPADVPEGCQTATLFFTSLPAKCLVAGKLVTVEPIRPTVFQDGQRYYIVPEDGDK